MTYAIENFRRLPFRDTFFRDAFRLNDGFTRLMGIAVREPDAEARIDGWVPPVDIFEDAEGITLRADLPGLSAAEVDVRIDEDTLTLSGERAFANEGKNDYRRLERGYGRFSRTFVLPESLDGEMARAESRNGVLTVFVPKREASKPRQIKVKVEG